MEKQTNQNSCFTKKGIFRGKVHKLSTLEAIRVIKQKLNPSQLKRFQSSCFGKLFQMSPEIKFSGQIIHHLLLRKVNHPNEDEMWFLIGNKRARFSKDEFVLVTGLNCGQKYPSRTGFDAGTRLVDKYFLGQNFITKKCLKQRLLSCNDDDNDDVFKLSLVYFLQALLMIRAGEASVDRYWLMLVEDLESFNEFPWGNLCFERTLLSMKKIAKENFGVESASESYTLRGFPFAFQIWAYEAIPLLGNKFAEKSSGNLIPRILCWESTRDPTYDELRESVFGVKNLRVLKKLRATELEREQDYMKAITESSLELEENDSKSHDDSESTRMESMKVTTVKKPKKHSKQKDMDAKLIGPCFTKKPIFRAKVRNLSTLDAIRVIKGKLNPSQLERFESSCFGKLFGMSTKIKFSSQIVHHLLSRRVDRPNEEDEMWFLIGREWARFSLNEFALVTGLNCGQKYPSRTTRNATARLVDKYFGGRKSIFTRCLKEQFLCCEDEEDSYRLSLVYFLQALLLAQNENSSIDKQWLSLVDDLELFEEFPWGNLCYKRTLLSLKKRAREYFKENGSENDTVEPMKTYYRLCGFPYAFQIWAYEAIPCLGRKFAVRSSRNSIPRILCWEPTKTPTFEELNHNVFSIKNLRVLKTLRATELEREQDYMKAISKSSLMLKENDSAESRGSCLELGEEFYDHDDDSDDISWGRGKGKRKRRTKKNNVTFPFKKCSKKKKLVTRANVNLNPNQKRDIMEISRPLEKNSFCNLQKFLGRDNAFMCNGDKGAQHSNGSRNYLNAFVCGGLRYNKPIPIHILKHLDAILQHELNLDFARDFRPSTTILNRIVTETEVVVLSDDD